MADARKDKALKDERASRRGRGVRQPVQNGKTMSVQCTLRARLALAAALLPWGPTLAQQSDLPAPPPALPATEVGGLRWQWGASAGFNHYREPSLDMRLSGPELGVHLRLGGFEGRPRWQLEADVLAGLHDYASPSGKLGNSENLETRWRALYQAWPRGEGGLFVGPAVHTLYNDLRGRTTLGAAGYQRTNIGLWLAAQWRQPLQPQGPLASLSAVQLDAGRLVRARHHSYLSQADRRYPDIGNTQRHGWYGQVRLDFKAQGLLLQPFVRYTRLKDSDESVVGFISGIEPASHRWQLGLQVSWPPH